MYIQEKKTKKHLPNYINYVIVKMCAIKKVRVHTLRRRNEIIITSKTYNSAKHTSQCPNIRNVNIIMKMTLKLLTPNKSQRPLKTTYELITIRILQSSLFPNPNNNA